MTKLAPPIIMKAALQVLHIAGCDTRNWTLKEGTVSRKQLNDLWEAIHEIPQLLTRWEEDSEPRLLMYLSEYSSKWPQPNLLQMYKSAKTEETSD
jgi:hypothetical protein